MSLAKVQPSGREPVAGRITGALVISLMLHFIGIAGIELGNHLGWWDRSIVSALLQRQVQKTARERAEINRQLVQPPPEAELVFVDVDPTQSTPEAPKDAKYYSAHNTAAANRTRDQESTTPKIDGKQDKILKTVDTFRSEAKAPQPAPPPEKEQSRAEVMQPAPQPLPPQQTAETPPAENQAKPEPPVEKGQTLLAKVIPREQPQAQPQPNNASPEQPQRRRPRNLAEAKAQKGIIEGPKMQQRGGARIAAVDGLDVKATPFGTYDAMFIEAVQARWFTLLDERQYVGNQSGKVVVEFHLHSDGRITSLGVVSASVNEMLSWFCQRAILDPAPYRPFPNDLRRMMNTDYREIRFTFYYNQ